MEPKNWCFHIEDKSIDRKRPSFLEETDAEKARKRPCVETWEHSAEFDALSCFKDSGSYEGTLSPHFQPVETVPKLSSQLNIQASTSIKVERPVHSSAHPFLSQGKALDDVHNTTWDVPASFVELPSTLLSAEHDAQALNRGQNSPLRMTESWYANEECSSLAPNPQDYQTQEADASFFDWEINLTAPNTEFWTGRMDSFGHYPSLDSQKALGYLTPGQSQNTEMISFPYDANHNVSQSRIKAKQSIKRSSLNDQVYSSGSDLTPGAEAKSKCSTPVTSESSSISVDNGKLERALKASQL